MRKYVLLFGLCLPLLSLAGTDPARIDERSLYFREAVYLADQDQGLDAITRLEIGLVRFYGLDNPDPLHFKYGYSSFSVGDMELSYRMPQRASRAIEAILKSSADQSVRNEAAYRLAGIAWQQGESGNALRAIEKITGNVSSDIREDVLFLRAQIYLANAKFAEAVKLLRELQDAQNYKGFATYNLGIALIKSGQEKEGYAQLDKVANMSAIDEVTLAIRDKANLVLGYRRIDTNQPALAKLYFNRIRSIGPFSNKALLGLGWADASLENFESALVPWTVLAKRNATDSTVQESMLSVPYAYAKLNLPGKAVLFYGRALKGFEQELTKLDASIQSVRAGKLLLVMQHAGLRPGANWIAKLKTLPQSPETDYLLELLAIDGFQESLKNYLDLDNLLNRLESWDENLNAYEEMIRLRRQYYQATLSENDKRLLALDARLKLLDDRRQRLDQQLSDNLGSSNNEYEYYLSSAYARAVEIYGKLQPMNEEIKKIKKAHASYVSLRQAIAHSYPTQGMPPQDYADQIVPFRNRVRAAMQKINTLMLKQGQALEVMAVDELEQRRKRLQEYQSQARYALAKSYERASKQQSSSGVAK